MEKAKELLREVMTEEHIDKLTELGYFTSPASSSHHLSVEGGLVEHSYNVTKAMLKINKDLNLMLDRKHIILSGMLHDLTKVGTYKPNVLKSGKVSELRPYIVDKSYDIGHGTESLYLALNELDLKLPVPVAQAIYWHMGFDYNKDRYSLNTLRDNGYDIALVWLMITADTFATWVMERTTQTVLDL